MIGSPVVELAMVVDEIQDVDPVEPKVVGKVVVDGLVENASVENGTVAVVLVGSDELTERLLTFKNLEIIHYVFMIGSPVVELAMVVDEIKDVDPVEPIVVGKVVVDGLVENVSVENGTVAVVLVGSDEIK
jgi:hypothetical protein